MLKPAACSCCGKPPGECTCWEFPGWGTVRNIVDLNVDVVPDTRPRLGVWRATAICGNDITSSCLYVSALAALYAGPLAPLALLLVAGVLYLFRAVYGEVGSALPLNGGAYNVLLNTTSKHLAALAACLTLLSYLATAVISGSEAMSYAAILLPGIHVFSATVVLLGAFAVLNIMGISDSASVALGIFVFHILTLSGLVLIGLASLLSDPSVIVANVRTPMAKWPTARNGSFLGFMLALFFGFSSAMLGISGFESSANYIEEQDSGVFPKTLRNMWVAVALFNPAISFLSLAVLPMQEIAVNKEALLSEMGRRATSKLGGLPAESLLPSFISGWISLDAVLVLSGAVLTSYVGVTGLVHRMSMDLCLPQFLLRQNRWRGTYHWIVLSFMCFSISILMVTAGKIEMLAGVYTLSFLSVMALFAIGCLLLKRKHPDLKRSIRASLPAVIIALLSVAIALLGNLLLNPEYVRVFVLYFVTVTSIAAIAFFRSWLFFLLLKAVAAFSHIPLLNKLANRDTIASWLQQVQCRSVVFVSTQSTVGELRAAANYVVRNEQLRFLKVVVCYEQESEITKELISTREELDEEFPQLHIDLLLLRGRLSPALLSSLGRRLGIPSNYIFISNTTAVDQDLSSWAGARIII